MSWAISAAYFAPGLLIGGIVGWLVIKPVNALVARSRTERPADPTTRNCPQCLSEIPIAASRCAFCTSEVGAAA